MHVINFDCFKQRLFWSHFHCLLVLHFCEINSSPQFNSYCQSYNFIKSKNNLETIYIFEVLRDNWNIIFSLIAGTAKIVVHFTIRAAYIILVVVSRPPTTSIEPSSITRSQRTATAYMGSGTVSFLSTAFITVSLLYQHSIVIYHLSIAASMSFRVVSRCPTTAGLWTLRHINTDTFKISFI